ncbi:hypothetical protein ACFE04_006258 [Oxalis oulophora]
MWVSKESISRRLSSLPHRHLSPISRSSNSNHHHPNPRRPPPLLETRRRHSTTSFSFRLILSPLSRSSNSNQSPHKPRRPPPLPRKLAAAATPQTSTFVNKNWHADQITK